VRRWIGDESEVVRWRWRVDDDDDDDDEVVVVVVGRFASWWRVDAALETWEGATVW
jgi:hypothetical protein